MGHATLIRTLCHVAAALPIVVVAAVQGARGWTPLVDDAAIAWRSWDVLSMHSPLVGHMTEAKVNGLAYGLGPLQNWILAIPVRLFPDQGALWGAAIACIVASSLAIEAAWSMCRWSGAVIASAAVLVLVMTRPDLIADLVWNPTTGVFWLMATVACGCVAAVGRLGWWPVAVLSASISAQCHEFYAIPALAICLVSLLVGLAARRSRGQPLGGRWWIVAGLVSVGCWLAPLIQQATGRPGNLGLLLHAARGSSHLGLGTALGGLGAAVRPFPDWLHIPWRGDPHFQWIVESFQGPKAWGVVVLALLVVIAARAWRVERRLSALALVALATDVGTVVSVALFPAGIGNVNAFSYLDAAWWPVGIATWITLGWAAVRLARSFIERRGRHQMWLRSRRPLQVCGSGLVLGLAVAATWTNVPLVGGFVWGGWSMMRTTEQAAVAVERVAPRRPFTLAVVGGPASFPDSLMVPFGMESGVVYRLHVRGLQPRFTTLGWHYFGAWTRQVPNEPVVTIELSRTVPTRVLRVSVTPSGSPVAGT